jgi:hypothetical protein
MKPTQPALEASSPEKARSSETDLQNGGGAISGMPGDPAEVVGEDD